MVARGDVVENKDAILITLLALAVGVQIGTWVMRRGAESAAQHAVDALTSVQRSLTPGPIAWGVVEIMGHRRLVGRLSTVYVLNEPYLKVEAFKVDGSFKEELYPERSVFSVRYMEELEARSEAVGLDRSPCGAFVESKILEGVCANCGQSQSADAKAGLAHEEKTYRNEVVRSIAKLAGMHTADIVVQWDDASGQVVRVVTWKSDPALTTEQWERATLEGLPMGPVECAARADLNIDTPDDCPF
jgi:hypothetical protein